MSVIISIGSTVHFSPSTGVAVTESALDVDPEVLQNWIAMAFGAMSDPLLIEACCGGRGPLAGFDHLTWDEYRAALRDIEAAERERLERKKALRRRRAKFDANRPSLIASMLGAGVPYRCAHDGCNESLRLTVDHVVPIAKGGTDDVANLQFLCLHHNQAKGARR